MYIINMIKELLCVKCQQFELSSLYFNCHDNDCMIDFLCTAQCYFFFFVVM